MNFGLTIQNYAVFQRNAANVSDYAFSGSCAHDGMVRLTARTADGVVPGLDNAAVGTAVRGHFSGVVKNLPVGGPYTLEFTLLNEAGRELERAAFTDILVGDLWILAGQSNMQGYGFFPELTPQSPLLHNFYMDNRWGIATQNLHNLAQAAAPVHGGNPKCKLPRKLDRGVGPGMSFAAAMYAATGVPQGTIACAHGGTTMNQWNPRLRKQGGYSLYGAMLERFEALGSNVAGMVWYQGCSDAMAGASEEYEAKFRAFLRAVRRDFDAPELPIVFVQLATQLYPGVSDADWSRVRQAQFEIGRSVKHTACVPAVDLELDDQIHLSARGQQILGNRLAYAMQQLQGMPDRALPIAPGKMRYCNNASTGMLMIELEFQNVVGKLVSGSLPHGFVTVDRNWRQADDCLKVELCGNSVRIHTTVFSPFADSHLVAYGFGTRDYCNITDEAGRSLPCFVREIKSLRKGMSALATGEVCETPLYGADAVADLALPPPEMKFIPAKFEQFYLAHPKRVALANHEHKRFYFRIRTDSEEAGEVRALFGADGPLAVYCDGAEVLRKNATNPLSVDEFAVCMTLSAGKHEWMLVLGANDGNAWGVCARFESLSGKPLTIE